MIPDLHSGSAFRNGATDCVHVQYCGLNNARRQNQFCSRLCTSACYNSFLFLHKTTHLFFAMRKPWRTIVMLTTYHTMGKCRQGNLSCNQAPRKTLLTQEFFSKDWPVYLFPCEPATATHFPSSHANDVWTSTGTNCHRVMQKIQQIQKEVPKNDTILKVCRFTRTSQTERSGNCDILGCNQTDAVRMKTRL